jgi:glutathione synthase/RimK-type ligase-like ATP-grasp enzyme
MTLSIALATYERAPGLAPDDRGLVPALAALGVHAEAVPWSSIDVDWRDYDAVVLRSTWDYHLRLDGFHAWLDRLASLGVAVMNSPSLVRWNTDKRYLLDLARKGVATIPTMVVDTGEADDVAQVATAEGWSRIVVKPAVSASGFETYAVDVPFDAAARASVERAVEVGAVLVQPFAPEVPRDGEYSFVFIDGEFSHAAIKRAGQGEFRVQTEHGGSVSPVAVDDSLVLQAAHVLAAAPEKPLYARVDGISRSGAFLLMELELIEPNLFLELREGAAAKLAATIVKGAIPPRRRRPRRRSNG